MRGNNGKMYVSAATAGGIFRWVPMAAAAATARKPRGKSYEIIDNGGVPFMVFVAPSKITIYRTNETGEEPTKEIAATPYKKLFVGDNDLRSPSYAPKGQDPGNSLLIQVSPQKYMYVGSEIYTFAPLEGDTIKAYYSPLGNSAVSYPYAIGEKYVYFMLDKVALDARMIDPAEDGYGQYYSKFHGVVKGHPFKSVKRVAKRVF